MSPAYRFAYDLTMPGRDMSPPTRDERTAGVLLTMALPFIEQHTPSDPDAVRLLHRMNQLVEEKAR